MIMQAEIYFGNKEAFLNKYSAPANGMFAVSRKILQLVGLDAYSNCQLNIFVFNLIIHRKMN